MVASPVCVNEVEARQKRCHVTGSVADGSRRSGKSGNA